MCALQQQHTVTWRVRACWSRTACVWGNTRVCFAAGLFSSTVLLVGVTLVCSAQLAQMRRAPALRRNLPRWLAVLSLHALHMMGASTAQYFGRQLCVAVSKHADLFSWHVPVERSL